MNPSTLNLNPVHAELLTDILKLTRYQQTQRIKSIDHCFKTSLSRLREDEVYTGEEVSSIVRALQDTVRTETETELKDASHTNGLLLQQLLANAELQYSTLTLDISELENREKLDMIRDFEDGKQPQEKKMAITVTQSKQIIPIQDMNVVSALKIEIGKLKEEKDNLQDKLKDYECKYKDITKELETKELNTKESIENLTKKLDIAQDEIRRLMGEIDEQETINSRNLELESVQKDIRRMSVEIKRGRDLAEEEAEKLRKDLDIREDKLRQVQTALLLTEKELEKKFQATSAYSNMKKILIQKNTIIKNLRKKLIEAGGNPEDLPLEED